MGKETDVFEQVSYDLYVEELDRRQKNEENFTQELGKMQQKVVDHRKRATTWYNTSKVQKRRIDRMQHTLQNIRKREADSEAKKQVAMRKKEILSLKKELRIMHSKEKRSVAQELGKQKKELKKKEKEREKLMAALEDTVNEGKEVIANLRSENVDLVRECAELNAENTLLKQSVDFLQSLLQENVPLHLKSRDGQGEGFTPETIHCVMDLLKTGVSSSQVKGVISTVAKLCRRKVTIDQLPSRSSVDNIRIRALAVAQTQLADLASEDNMTLYTDETTKKGTKVMAYGITTKNKETKVLGIKQMVTKSAKDTLDTLCKVVQEVTDACQIQGVGDRIITNIKNTMSDRASTEKLFNSILQEYRSDLLPQIDANFSKMSDTEQENAKMMHNFFCGLHLMVSFADSFSTATNKLDYETGHKAIGAAADTTLKPFLRSSEPSSIRFERTTAKLFAPGGQDKFGVHDLFTQHLKAKEKENHLVDFNRQRFNIVFYDGAMTYYLAQEVSDFIKTVYGTGNTLLKAVLLDSEDPWCLARARALGLLSKLVTGPLFRVIEDKHIHISDIGNFYQNLSEFMSSCLRSDDVLSLFIRGEAAPEHLKSRIHHDEVYKYLIRSNSTDKDTATIIRCVFQAWVDLLQRIVPEHLEGVEIPFHQHFSAAVPGNCILAKS